MNETIHEENLGRYIIKIIPDYDSLTDANEWGYTGAKLYAKNRDFHVMPDNVQTLIEIIQNAEDDTRFYFVFWQQYSSSSNPVLRHFINPQGDTRNELALKYFENSTTEQERKDWFNEHEELSQADAVEEYFLQYCVDMELDSDVMIVVDKCKPEKGKDVGYYGSTGNQDRDAKDCLDDWHSYLDGAYGFTIEDEEGEIVESCWGFYGEEYPIEKSHVLQEARAIAKQLEKEAKAEDRKIKKEAKKPTITMQTTLADMLLCKNEQVKRLAKGIYKVISK